MKSPLKEKEIWQEAGLISRDGRLRSPTFGRLIATDRRIRFMGRRMDPQDPRSGEKAPILDAALEDIQDISLFQSDDLSPVTIRIRHTRGEFFISCAEGDPDRVLSVLRGLICEGENI